jgi:transposase
MHRPLEGRIKNVTVKYDAGEWYAALICELPDQPKIPLKDVQESRIKGGDLGLERFLTLSESSLPNYPRFLRRSEVKIKRLQRVLLRASKDSKNFRRLAFRIARLKPAAIYSSSAIPEEILPGIVELFDALLRLGVLRHLLKHLVRYGDNMSTRNRRLGDVLRLPYAPGNYLRLETAKVYKVPALSHPNLYQNSPTKHAKLSKTWAQKHS